MALNAVSGGGTQTNTQNPQSSTAPGGGATQGSSVQPGTTSSLLNSGAGGVPLTVNSLPTVSLNGTGTTQTTYVAPPVHHRHVSPVLIGFVAALFVLAVVLFWLTSRSSKITTEY